MSATPLATWNVKLEPSKKTTIRIAKHADLKITNAALDAILADENGRSTVLIEIQNAIPESDEDEDEDDDDDSTSPLQKFALTSLIPRIAESTIHDTVITRPADVTFEVVGENTIHLSGYYYLPPDPYGDDDDDDDEYDEDDEDGFFLGDVASDVEYLADDAELEDDSDVDMPDDAHRFEEVIEDVVEGSPELGKKRPREPEVATLAKPEAGEKLSKKAKKKLKALQAAAEKDDTATGPAAGSKDAEGPPQKKAKNANGAAVPVDKNKKDNKPAAANATSKPKPAHPEGKQEKKPKEKEPEKEKGKGAEQSAKNDSIGKTKQLPGGLTITDKKAGSGAVAKKGSKIQVRYIGKLSNGTVFDKNTSGRPFDFKLGAGEVIKGWDEGFEGMKVGGERVIVVPPKMGYGNSKQGFIPPNSTLTFEVKLLGVS